MGKACSCGRRSEAIPEHGQKTVMPTNSHMEEGHKAEHQSLLESDSETHHPETHNSEKKESGGEKSDDGGIAGTIFGCCVCCCCLLLALSLSIPAVVASSGYTECPKPGSETLVNSEPIYLPNWHIMEKPKYQFAAFWSGQEINVFDPSVSNETRMGFWRTTKTWFLRTQFAYVSEGSESPQVVVSTPFFTWTTEYDIELCPAQKQWKVKQNAWVWGGFFQQLHEYHIYEEPGEKLIAKAEHTKDSWNWHGWLPDGWKCFITSEVEPGKRIGAMIQMRENKLMNFFATVDSRWVVVDEQPALLSPTVMSFLAASYDIGKDEDDSDSSSDRRRRR